MPSVLVIDDDDQIRRMIREALEQAGYIVQEARGGEDGIKQYRESPTDVVLMDILMPDQDGLESILALRQEFPSARVIAMTGGSDMIGIMNFLDVAKMMGACRTIQKPFDLQTLLAAVAAEIRV